MIFSSFCFSSSLTFGVLELQGEGFFFSRSAMLLGKEGKRLRNNETGGSGVSFKKSNTRTPWDF